MDASSKKQEIDEAIVKVEVGTEKKSHKYTEKEKKIILLEV